VLGRDEARPGSRVARCGLSAGDSAKAGLPLRVRPLARPEGPSRSPWAASPPPGWKSLLLSFFSLTRQLSFDSPSRQATFLPSRPLSSLRLPASAAYSSRRQIHPSTSSLPLHLSCDSVDRIPPPSPPQLVFDQTRRDPLLSPAFQSQSRLDSLSTLSVRPLFLSFPLSDHRADPQHAVFDFHSRFTSSSAPRQLSLSPKDVRRASLSLCVRTIF
jgi:hypothetical protein